MVVSVEGGVELGVESDVDDSGTATATGGLLSLVTTIAPLIPPPIRTIAATKSA